MKRAFYLLAISTGFVAMTLALSSQLSPLVSEQLLKYPDSSRIDPSLKERLSWNEEIIPIIMMYNDTRSPDYEWLKDAGLQVGHRYSLINGASAVGSAVAISRLAEEPWIESIHLDGAVHAAGPIRSWGNYSGQSPANKVNVSDLWSQGINGSGVTVAVLDSGIDRNHPDLIDKVIGEVNFIRSEETTSDLLGHGTMCAGIIAGSGEASGGRYRGIAPGAKLLNVRVIDSGGEGQDSDIIAGIEWALNNGADVISMSLGGLDLGQTDLPVTTAADNAMDAGAIVCVAAGNSG